jgi:hypothetical protein
MSYRTGQPDPEAAETRRLWMLVAAVSVLVLLAAMSVTVLALSLFS